MFALLAKVFRGLFFKVLIASVLGNREGVDNVLCASILRNVTIVKAAVKAIVLFAPVLQFWRSGAFLMELILLLILGISCRKSCFLC